MDNKESNASSDLTTTIAHLLNSQQRCVLATCGQGIPHTSLMSYAATSDLRVLIMATARNTRKYVNLKNNPAVSILVDNRTEKSGGKHAAMALTVEGLARDAAGNETDLRDLFQVRHDRLSSFVVDPGTALVVVQVSKYILVTGFSQVDTVIL